MAAKVIATKMAPLAMFLLLVVAYVGASPMRGNVASNQVEPDCGPSAALTADPTTIGRELGTNTDDHVDVVDPDCGPSSAIFANDKKEESMIIDSGRNVVANGDHNDTTEPDCGPSAALTVDHVTIGRELSTKNDHADVVDPDCGPSSAVFAQDNKDSEAIDTGSSMTTVNVDHTDTTEPDCGPTAALVASSKSDSSEAAHKKSILG